VFIIYIYFVSGMFIYAFLEIFVFLLFFLSFNFIKCFLLDSFRYFHTFESLFTDLLLLCDVCFKFEIFDGFFLFFCDVESFNCGGFVVNFSLICVTFVNSLKFIYQRIY